MQINPELRGHMPQVEAPVPFTVDGVVRGWKVTIPGRHPLATPAIVGGRVFLGGGFGSYDFYALDAATGTVVWQYQTSDDGPTAAVVEDDVVAFNTESCELEVLTVEGKPVWKKWLGDPLMSMPAIHQGRIFMVYPDTRGDQQHYLACFDLRNGAEYWKQPVEGEVITAPIVADDHVYLATLEGTLYCFNAKDGTRVWQEEKNATSSPVVWNQQCYFSQREEVPLAAVGKAGWQQRESLSGRGVDAGAPTRRYHKTTRDADYLDHEKRLAGSPRFMACETADAGVGFGMHKGDAKMAQAIKNLGHSHVSGIWAYQGSKPFLSRGRLYSALGDTVHCVDPQSEEVLWKKNLHQTREQNELLDSVVTPPALVNGKVFVGTILGDVCCLSADSGEMLWVIHVGEPVAFQVAVAGGRVYAPTAEGSLFCLETGNPDDDGWLMWGATAAHNGLVE